MKQLVFLCRSVYVTLVLLMLLGTATPLQAASSLDYNNVSNWAYFALGEKQQVDVFLLCPTVDRGKEGQRNMDVNDMSLRRKFVGALNMERGIYEPTGRLFAPFYRQATLSTYGKPENELALREAYQDVRAAFTLYLAQENHNRPFILAGFSQGGDMALRLLKEFFPFGDPRLIATFVQGFHFSRLEQQSYPGIRPAQGERDSGVLVVINTEAPEITSSLIVPTDTCGINPLNWKTDGTIALAEENPGACFTDYEGKIRRETARFCGAYLDTQRGVIKVTGVDQSQYPPLLSLFAPGVYHVYDYQFFYRALQRNVAVRTEAYLQQKRSAKE